jgi:predicted transcriptional regulator
MTRPKALQDSAQNSLDISNSNSLELVRLDVPNHRDFKEHPVPRPASVHPTDGELEILRVLWAEGPSALSAVCKLLRHERDVATTTVATMLGLMQDKGLVKRQGAGRGALWAAAVTHKSAARGMVRKLVDGVFDGSADRLVTHLVEGGQLSQRQLAELRQLIDSHSKNGQSKHGRTKKGAHQ